MTTLNYETCQCLSRVSLALFMRLRLVSVVGEFLWSGERPVDDDFPGGH